VRSAASWLPARLAAALAARRGGAHARARPPVEPPHAEVPPTCRREAVDTGRLALHELTVRYGTRVALDRVTLAFPPRAVTALIGPSGCGKTTLLRAANRLIEQTPGAQLEGRVELDGENVRAPEVDVAALRQRVGMVFQRWTPFRSSVYDNVAYGARLSGVVAGVELDAVVESALRRASLWDEVRDRLRDGARTLSEGQQQRLCIARALAPEPEVLLLDEPTSALDPGATQRIEELLYELRRQVTIVLVTHNLQQAARASDYTAFLASGRLVEFDATDRLFTSPRDRRTEAYITGRFG
jgi:phosphate transport system ATP-binding protein